MPWKHVSVIRNRQPGALILCMFLYEHAQSRPLVYLLHGWVFHAAAKVNFSCALDGSAKMSARACTHTHTHTNAHTHTSECVGHLHAMTNT